jgi:DNA helicase HerA-like ATPase
MPASTSKSGSERNQVGPDNTIISVLGMKGTGKTTLVREVVDEYPRVVVVDSLGEYGDAQGWMVAYTLEGAVKALVDAETRPRFSLSYRPDDTDEALRFLTVVRHAHGLLLVMDEANIYMTPSELPKVLGALIRRGRHNGLSQIYVAQRAASLHREVTAQSDVIIAFRQQEPRDLQYLRSRFGERADWLPHLQPHHALVEGIEAKVPLAAEKRRVVENPLTRQSRLL